jgi:hypothetical protein
MKKVYLIPAVIGFMLLAFFPVVNSFNDGGMIYKAYTMFVFIASAVCAAAAVVLLFVYHGKLKKVKTGNKEKEEN